MVHYKKKGSMGHVDIQFILPNLGLALPPEYGSIRVAVYHLERRRGSVWARTSLSLNPNMPHSKNRYSPFEPIQVEPQTSKIKRIIRENAAKFQS